MPTVLWKHEYLKALRQGGYNAEYEPHIVTAASVQQQTILTTSTSLLHTNANTYFKISFHTLNQHIPQYMVKHIWAVLSTYVCGSHLHILYIYLLILHGSALSTKLDLLFPLLIVMDSTCYLVLFWYHHSQGSKRTETILEGWVKLIIPIMSITQNNSQTLLWAVR